jgi:glyoxylase-like metal-dependent hydrolase (beta-lactamase superfamily II)
MTIDTFTGGMFETNCFFLPESGILIDAPQESADWLDREGHKVRLLLLTHGHIDHVWDAARIQREHGCPVGCHPETAPMVSEPEFFRQYGFALEIETLIPDLTITETPARELGGINFQILEIPGHCPGSLCFYSHSDTLVFGGDVLFAGGVGRWDLPGGDKDILFSGIKSKLFSLPEDAKILPGHGPATTIGRERKENPFVGDLAG